MSPKSPTSAPAEPVVATSSSDSAIPRLTADKHSNRLHPVQVEYSYPLGSWTDMEEPLPGDLLETDPEALLDRFSSPVQYIERIAPVSAQLDGDKLSGKNPTELQVKFIRRLAKRLDTVAQVLERANIENFGEKGPVAFMGLCLDPDTITRIIELDYETADNVYSRIAALWDKGHISPVITTPFHTMLPLYQNDFDVRLLVRIGLEFYWPMLKKYNATVRSKLGEEKFTATVALPEGAFSSKVLQIFHEVFLKRCEEEGIAEPHLIFLLDCEQSRERETDLLMKRWNTLRPSPLTRDIVTIIYRERLFSDWVVTGHPSTKKQLDRTIAKVDAVLRDQGVDHLWSHWERLMTLLSTFKTCTNFEQKLIKLAELGYQPCGPDVFARRKILKKLGMAEDDDPRRTSLRELTCWNSYEDAPGSMVRFTGVEDHGNQFNTKLVLGKDRPYDRVAPDGTVKKMRGNPCWKHALLRALQTVHRAIVGEPKTLMGGMLGLLRDTVPIRRVPLLRQNIEDFLVVHARIHWKEHFIHHIYSEADIRVEEFAREYLLQNLPEDAERDTLDDEEIAICAAAAEAIYHAHMGLSSTAFAFENMDQRATYQNVSMMTLAVVHAVYAFHWAERPEDAKALLDVFERELLNFSEAFTRHGIDKLGVPEKLWRATIKSHVADSDLNVVERAARRVAAIHLRPLGYRKEFDRKDEYISSNVGHIWTYEIQHSNLEWENETFCGLQEE
ncbi:MAG: hypothetical protein RLY93_03270 [Sumerlaeia bacterium]